MSIHKVLIIGSNGGFGQLIAGKMEPLDMEVNGIDLAAESQNEYIGRYISCDVTELNDEAAGLIRQSDCIIISLPERIALESFNDICSHANKSALVVDVLSVKTDIVNLMNANSSDLEFLSIHPMFAPSLGFENQNVIAIEVHKKSRTEDFLLYLKKWGAHIDFMSAGQHDKGTALMQTAVHAAVLAYGLTLEKMDYDIKQFLPLSTPPHRTLLAMNARILDADPDIFWKIQASNPESDHARKTLAHSLKELDSIVNAEDEEAFKESLNKIKRQIEPEFESLVNLCAKLYATKIE